MTRPGLAARMRGMEYLAVLWSHGNSIDPIELFSELDDSRSEVRKVEIFPDGRAGYADATTEFGGTGLGIVPVPSLLEISIDPQFVARVISVAEFEEVWSRALDGDSWRPPA